MPELIDIVKESVGDMLKERGVQRRVARLVAHPVTLLAIATVMATVAGVWLTHYYQQQAWIREQRFEVYRQGYRESLELVDELTEAMSRRFFGLNRVVWVAKGTGTGELEPVWAQYYQTVEEWNTKIMSYQGRVDRYVGGGAAAELGSWQEAQAEEPQTIHGRFLQAHERARALVDCVRQGCDEAAKAAAARQAEQAVNALGLSIERFTRACTDQIHRYAGE